MAANTNSQSSTDNHIRTHAHDYAKFISWLKMSIIAVAIIAAIVIYIISN